MVAADVWLRLQVMYDLWQAEQASKQLLKKVKPIEPERFVA
jgi:plasmid maintenance system antidote protein VapI